MNIKQFKVGDEVLVVDKMSKSSNNNARPKIISKVGNKFVYIGRTAYYLKDKASLYLTEKRDWGSPNMLFATIEDYNVWKEECELSDWKWRVKDLPLTVDQLRKMKQIADGDSETENVSEYNPVDEFICLKCGLVLQDYVKVLMDEDGELISRGEYEIEYCPHCGRKVINNER